MNKWIVGAGVVAVPALIGVAAVAQTGDEVIDSCVDRAGAVRIVDGPDECRTSPAARAETPLAWNSGGGIAGYEVVRGSQEFGPGDGDRGDIHLLVPCPEGKRLLSGGGGPAIVTSVGPDDDLYGLFSDTQIVQNGPPFGPFAGDDVPEESWLIAGTFSNRTDDITFEVHAYAICAFVTS